MTTLNIGLFGCGTVGSGVYRLLEEQQARIAHETGVRLVVKRVSVLHPEKKRSVAVLPKKLTTRAEDIFDDPEIDVVIEVIGGEREALDIITRALLLGKKVVTANKVVVSHHLPLLRLLEQEHGGRLFYGASVCGSVPVLKIIDETLLVDRVQNLRGIVNGSTNYILTRLAEGIGSERALDLAREHGFLEADPSADLSGADAAQKLSILAYHAFGQHIPPEAIETTGIESITLDDLEAARLAGCTIKLVAGARRHNGQLRLKVEPTLVPLDDPFASIRDEVNIVEVECEGIGTQRFVGRGAGSIPTANAIVSDLLDLLADRRYRRREQRHPATEYLAGSRHVRGVPVQA